MTPAETEQLINDIEKDLDRLSALYNQYFMGIEKLEPSIPRKNLDRKIAALRREQIKNTALRFRLQMQIQKYNTQSTYWNRICRQIENGTYKKQVSLAKRRMKTRHQFGDAPTEHPSNAPSMRKQSDLEEAFHIDLDEFGSDLNESMQAFGVGTAPKTGMVHLDDPFADLLPDKTAAESAPASPAAGLDPKTPPLPSAPPKKQPTPPPIPKKRVASAAKPPPVSPAAVDQEKLKTIYRRYLAARKKCNEPTHDLSYNLVAESLKERIKTAGGHVDFKVVIRGGKAVIKTVKTEA